MYLMSTIVFTNLILQDIMNILHNVGIFSGSPLLCFFIKTGDHMDSLPYSRRYTELFMASLDNCKMLRYFVIL